MNILRRCLRVPGIRQYSTITEQAQRTDRPLRLAVIGAGPAGFYTSYRVLSKLTNAHVDMYESLPVPYGLVRFGVAPDHPEVKKCQEKFDEVASSDRFNYIGNIAIGTSSPNLPFNPLPLSHITPHYDAVLLSYGAAKDKKLGIDSEDTLKGVYSARAFVGWYNGLPEYAGFESQMLLDSAEEAVIIGQGNVALDVARILLTPVDDLRKTDITEQAIEALSKSRVRSVRVMGRRGPLQAAFTVKELRELLSIDGLGFGGVDPSFFPAELKTLPRTQKRVSEILQRGSKSPYVPGGKTWDLGFCRSPAAFLPSESDSTTLCAVRFEKTTLSDPIFSDKAKVTGTGEFVDVKAQMAFRSIGYLPESLPGFEEAGIPFNTKWCFIPNENGRVVKPAKDDGSAAERIPGVYTSGWVKRGPVGVIASTMFDAFETGDAIVEDWVAGREFMGGKEEKHGWEAVQSEVKNRGLRPVNWEEWQKIDKAERERGQKVGKEREKFVTYSDMLSVLN
ncbi:Similar to NADPH:adrenodoxin oxidoreductase, mitochondrial; acc. no. P22570 [Pyronema omphalodes CBS 100304]|uniref:NADPH:adrenodoxin oxidoreductase, mitochondrial n=1 Tax=Pyronema omphalodes (strain CBS 100304) TaxID=1076935 RepID=U4L2W1_PYROM|nr:Similar to NADPH:adrenodoxin oxidoreductase, mitochondrial; acc. no. P22570 [Pyronema omphalodes CBS 100304]